MIQALASSLLRGFPVRRLRATVRRAQPFIAAARALADEELAREFAELGTPTRRTLPRSLALAQEAAFRSLGLRPYPVQLMGAAAIFDGVIAEMKTGEGKTLVIGLAAAMAALERRGVHVAVPNPYLAARDAETLRPFYEFLGLTVGVNMPGLSREEKQAAYHADVTYTVHSELGFDYLRDHLVARTEQRVQRGLHFAIVDEADSILIDEARTPLVISLPAADETHLVQIADAAVRTLRRDVEVVVDEAERVATLTEAGMDRVSAWLVAMKVIPSARALYEPAQLHLVRYLNAALRARFVFRRDKDYLVQDGQVQIIDPSTGRVLNGRRWQHGLHQAIEIKEGVPVQAEFDTAAEITYQNFFGLYPELAGLTGTAVSAADEFETIYGKSVVEIPTHRPCIRRDEPDLLFADVTSKFHAIVDDVVDQHEAGRPVLIGAGSVEESEALSKWLDWAGVPHRVLNARQNAEEARIIAEAGRPGAVTVATSMAGRGTDILLGGHDPSEPGYDERRAQVVKAGGLHVIGTQRQESRRVDDQLRGRAGRQGDPGSSRFYLSLDDELLRVYGAKQWETLAAVTNQAKDGEGACSRLIDKAVRRAQQKIESMHFGARHQMSQTDGAIAQQREAVYEVRNGILEGRMDSGYVEGMIAGTIARTVDTYLDSAQPAERWDVMPLKTTLSEGYGVDLPLLRWVSVENLSRDEIRERIIDAVLDAYRAARGNGASDTLTEREKVAVLSALDRSWREQLTELDRIREGIHLRSFAQENPVYMFAKEARAAFDDFQAAYEDMATSYLFQIARTEGGALAPASAPAPVSEPAPVPASANASAATVPPRRLAPCPCGSGRRYKHCHGALA